MHYYSQRQAQSRPAARPAHSAKPWTKLLAFLALIAIPAICTAW